MANFMSEYAKSALRNGPSLRKCSALAPTAQQDAGDTTPFENDHGFLGKTPVTRDKLYQQIAEKAKVNLEDLDIQRLAGIPRNALHYGCITGIAKAQDKTYQFMFFYNKNGEVDDTLSTMEEVKDE